jgi:hypothetical protein
MTYTLEKLSDEPIILHTLLPEHSFSAHGEQSLTDIFNMLDAQAAPVYVIFDMTDANFNLDDVMRAANVAMKQIKILSHPKMREAVVVTHSRLLKLAADGMKSATFGNANIRAFDSRNAALAYIRGQEARHA